MKAPAEDATMFATTVQLALRIAIVWAAGMILAVTVGAALPDKAGFTFTSSKTTLFVSYGRVGFWTCVVAALVVTGLVVFRAILADIGLSSFQ
ncbi:MAG TPA: hypothetical protein VL967_16125 [Terracidiphilus sp.]|jgi:hypothetical protein|nr:hypothetical protein [Terracidiphilus sp.]